MSNEYPVVNAELCVGCGACESACPRNAIEIIDNIARINNSKCRKCGNCIDVCPVEAITYMSDSQ